MTTTIRTPLLSQPVRLNTPQLRSDSQLTTVATSAVTATQTPIAGAGGDDNDDNNDNDDCDDDNDDSNNCAASKFITAQTEVRPGS